MHDAGWRALQAYVGSVDRFLTRHQLDSFDEFLNVRLPLAIRSMNRAFIVPKRHELPDGKVLTTSIKVFVGGRDGSRIFLDRPKHDAGDGGVRVLLPNEARLRGMTYGSRVLCDVVVEVVQDGGAAEEFTLERVDVGTVPIMLHSSGCVLRGRDEHALREMGECPFDQGGYFIVDGKEKVVVSQLRLANNRLYVERVEREDDPVAFKGFIRCTADRDSVFPKTMYMRVRRQMNEVRLTCNMLEEIPLFHLFRLLGVESDRQILTLILGADPTSDAVDRRLLDFWHGSIVDGSDIATQAQAVERYQRQVEPQSPERLLGLLLEDLLVNVEPDLGSRARYLGFLADRMARTCLGQLLPEDRDDHRSKRVDLAGVLVGNIYRDFYNELRAQGLKYIDSQYEIRVKYGKVNVRKIFDEPGEVFGARIVSDGLRASLKGRWGLQKLGFKKIDGIVQDLNRVSFAGYTSHVRRVSAPLDAASKIVEPHRLYGSQYGYLCPSESPDGPNIGLLVHLSATCEVTAEVDVGTVLEALGDRVMPLGVQRHGTTKVFANGTLRGNLKPGVSAKDVVDDLRARRRSGAFDRTTSVCWRITDDEIHVLTEAGRTTRPLLHLAKPDDGVVKTWDALCTDGTIEFLDAAESDEALIAAGVIAMAAGRYTHRELHPATMLSPYTCSIPFADRNAAPRNAFSGAQGRQALGVFATNFASRMDTHSYVLTYGQRPVVGSRLADLLGVTPLPNGENLVVAVMCFSGYNQEDSVIINRAAVDRGALAVTAYETMTFQESSDFDGATGELRRKVFAPASDKPRFKRYDALGPDGLPLEGVEITGDHAILGTREVAAGARGRHAPQVREVDEFADKFAEGTVDRVYVDVLGETGDRFCRVRVRQWRRPELGDKMASRHGQKGVVGMLMPPEDMPFCAADGTVPDMIVNPHAFPSRMTVGHLVEALVAKRGVARGAREDGTPFGERGDLGDVRDAYDVLHDPRSGEQVPVDVFYAPTYYFRLKHMVRDKINYRAGTGPRDRLTRQPVHGRADEGGLRLGEMERDVLIAHGAQGFLKEAFVEKADAYVERAEDPMEPDARVPYAWHLMRHEVRGILGVDVVASADPPGAGPVKPWLAAEDGADAADDDDAFAEDSNNG